MPDKTRKLTDKKLSRLERKIASIYSQSEKEIRADWDDYMKRLEKRLSKKQAAVDVAVKSGDGAAIKEAQEEFQRAARWGTLMDEKYKSMVARTTERLANVNKVALAYTNGELPAFYAINYNGLSDEIKNAAKSYGFSYDFSLVNEETIRQMTLLGERLLLPESTLKIAKDKRWNTKKVNNAVLQAILQGEDIPKMAERIRDVTNDNFSAAVRNARTMVTAAENRGRLAGMERAENNGIVLQKTWIATADKRTRPTHLALDGLTIDTNKLFPNGLLHPGDRAGKAMEVYNCRCTLTTHIVGFRRSNGKITYIHHTGDEEDLHGKQIAQEKQKRRE